ncbi:hypothetical protein [Acinetobacter soli]|uniref:hypothetical protein n=1 Tax=Acinetobacter soli TaxID=487316 RepID=UPI00280C6701|nr:hypothetical protein [Acinetobacter soli]MDQ8942048.1 hypothetical protein [Acinetobacter soli]
MSNRIFSYSDDEDWSGYDNPHEAIQDMKENDDLEVGNVFLTGIRRDLTPESYFPNADDLLEQYDGNIYDNCGEYAHDNTGSDQVTDEAKQELNDFLKSWASKHLSLSCYEVDHEEEITLTQEMIDAFHKDEPIPLPEFQYKEND